MVSYVFRLAESFSNAVNTMEGNGKIVAKEGGLPDFDTDILNTFFIYLFIYFILFYFIYFIYFFANC